MEEPPSGINIDVVVETKEIDHPPQLHVLSAASPDLPQYPEDHQPSPRHIVSHVQEEQQMRVDVYTGPEVPVVSDDLSLNVEDEVPPPEEERSRELENEVLQSGQEDLVVPSSSPPSAQGHDEPEDCQQQPSSPHGPQEDTVPLVPPPPSSSSSSVEPMEQEQATTPEPPATLMPSCLAEPEESQVVEVSTFSQSLGVMPCLPYPSNVTAPSAVRVSH